MRRNASSIGLVVVGLCVGVGCPQLRDDDFRSGSVNVGGGGTAGGIDGIAGGEALGGRGGATGTCGAGSGGCADAGSGGSAGESPPIDGGTGAEPGSGCGVDEVRGPNGDCYFADSAESTWSAARTSCQSRGAGWDLVAISDADENALVLSTTGYEAWIGAVDVVSEGSWLWVDDVEPFFEVGADDSARFTNWAEDEPNDYEDSDCLRILTTGLWADWPCDSPLGHVCRRRMP